MADDKELFELSRRKALAGLGTIGAASAGAGLGTSAFFSDTESFEGNSLTAGELDMKVAYSAHYSDWSDDEGDGISGVDMVSAGDGSTTDLSDDSRVGLPLDEHALIAVDDDAEALQFLSNTQYADEGTAACTDGTDDDDLEQPVIDLGDVKPGDFGEVTFDFILCDNPGYVWLQGNLDSASENGLSEPEAEDPDEEEGKVELLDEVQVAYWIDDGDNYQDGNESPAFVGSLRDALDTSESGSIAADLANDDFGAALSGDISASDGGGTGEQGCFSASTKHSVAFAWWLPVDHANEIQTDSAEFSLSFYTEQCRHNDGEGQAPESVAFTQTEGFGTNSGTFYDLTEDAGYPRDNTVIVEYGDPVKLTLKTPKPLDDADGDNWSMTFDADNDDTADFQVTYNSGFGYQEFSGGSWGSASMPGGISTTKVDGQTYEVSIPASEFGGTPTTIGFGGQLRYNGEEPGTGGSQNFVINLVDGFSWGPGFNGDASAYRDIDLL